MGHEQVEVELRVGEGEMKKRFHSIGVHNDVTDKVTVKTQTTHPPGQVNLWVLGR